MSKKSKSKRTTRTILNVPLKKPTPGDIEQIKLANGGERADLKAVERTEEFRVFRFSDGSFLKFAINPVKPGTFVIHDGKNNLMAVTSSPAAAGMICQAVNFMFAYQQHAREQEARNQAAAELADAALPTTRTADTPTADAPTVPAAPLTVLPPANPQPETNDATTTK